MTDNNHVRLDWGVDSIQVGARHRKDLGDIDTLKASIDEHGLLQPLTITEEGVLICGRRRLEAIRQLGWRQVNVWVRVGLSQKLSAMMAEREDQVNLKPYTVTEMAEMYDELKKEIAAAADKRMRAAQFGPGGVKPGDSGVGNFTTPLEGDASGVGNLPTPLGEPTGDSRQQAAEMVGGASYMTMEKVVALREIVADVTRPDHIREQATDALKRIEDKQPVDPLYAAVRALVRLDDLRRIADDETETAAVRDTAQSGVILLRKLEAANMGPADLDKAARAALDRVKAARKPGKPAPTPKPPKAKPPVLRTLKWFTFTWDELSGWTSLVDPAMVAAGLDEPQWQHFRDTVTETVKFMDTVAELRQAT